VRVLESLDVSPGGEVQAASGETRLFVHPGHQFRLVDGLITNFHLPRSSLLMLVAAFAGRERLLDAYREAVSQGYRFYSYGDAMLVV
jgi:S-adenosylmethionine:tRNA ribosyltransferase-isomerase